MNTHIQYMDIDIDEGNDIHKGRELFPRSVKRADVYFVGNSRPGHQLCGELKQEQSLATFTCTERPG